LCKSALMRLLIWVILSFNWAWCRDIWTPLDWATLPKAFPGNLHPIIVIETCEEDKVSVWYLVAPLLEQDVGNLLAGLQLYHGGIGFTNQYLIPSINN
jgi:hypothetical protein